jgi:hypothetical protein
MQTTTATPAVTRTKFSNRHAVERHTLWAALCSLRTQQETKYVAYLCCPVNLDASRFVAASRPRFTAAINATVRLTS